MNDALPDAKRARSPRPAKTPRTPRSGRPAQPLITRPAAAKAALAVIDRLGLEGLSLAEVAKVLGVSAPSLYHHFRDKEELLEEVTRYFLAEVGREPASLSENWEERTTQLCLATRRVALRHPNAASLALRFFPRILLLPAYERTLQTCPYPPEALFVLLEVTEKFTYGASLFAASAKARGLPAMPDFEVDRFPMLAAAREAASDDEEALFLEALQVIFAGLRARYAAPG